MGSFRGVLTDGRRGAHTALPSPLSGDVGACVRVKGRLTIAYNAVIFLFFVPMPYAVYIYVDILISFT